MNPLLDNLTGTTYKKPPLSGGKFVFKRGASAPDISGAEVLKENTEHIASHPQEEATDARSEEANQIRENVSNETAKVSKVEEEVENSEPKVEANKQNEERQEETVPETKDNKELIKAKERGFVGKVFHNTFKYGVRWPYWIFTKGIPEWFGSSRFGQWLKKKKVKLGILDQKAKNAAIYPWGVITIPYLVVTRPIKWTFQGSARAIGAAGRLLPDIEKPN